MTQRALRREGGQVAGFVVIAIVGLLMAAGLAFDGGRILAGRRQAADVARASARAGAQTLDPRTHTLDTGQATDQARRYFTTRGYTGTVTVDATAITVTVQHRVDMAILPIGSRTVTGRATASAVDHARGAP